MKKYLYILMIALFFVVQQAFVDEIHFFTLHKQGQRKMIAQLHGQYKVLPGEHDEHLFLRRKALFSLRGLENREIYIVFLHDRALKRDFIHLYDAESFRRLDTQTLHPYRLHPEDDEFRGTVDLNGDGNLEIAAVANSRSGKKLRIFSIQQMKIEEIPLNMAEDYAIITIEDINRDGKLEIIAQTKSNGILQSPEIFHYGDRKLEKLILTEYPLAINRYEKYLEGIRSQISPLASIYEIQSLDLELSRLRFFLDLGRHSEFEQLFLSLRHDLALNMDHAFRLRLYRARIYAAWLWLESEEPKKAEDAIYTAIIDFHAMTQVRSEQETNSQIHVEKARFFRWKNELGKARQHLSFALNLNPHNLIAKDLLESIFLEDAQT